MIADRTRSQRDIILSLGIEDADSVLDVGCGNGEKTNFLSQHVKHMVGIDPDIDMINSAKRNFGRNNLNFQVGQAESIAFPSSTFDSVLFIESFHHIPFEKHIEAVNESCRVLKAKGKLLIIEPIYGKGSFEEILQYYDNERDYRQQAIQTIETATNTAFKRSIKKKIYIEYSCKGFDDLYKNSIRTKPYATWNDIDKQDIIDILRRCKKTPEGDSIVDYFASVWLFVKR